jgi:hypothetical protein
MVICFKRSFACDNRLLAWDILDSMVESAGLLSRALVMVESVERIWFCMEENSSLYRENGITVVDMLNGSIS